MDYLEAYLWLAGNEGMETKMDTTIMGYPKPYGFRV